MVKQILNSKKIGKVTTSLALAALCQGCNLTAPDTHCYLDAEGYYQNCDNSVTNYEDEIDINHAYTSVSTSTYIPNQEVSDTHFKLLDEYAEQVASQLAEGINEPVRGGIAVASFVYLDGELKNSSPLGNQFSESLIHELQLYGLPVVDTKVSNMIKVSNTGDFIFSRKASELSHGQRYRYVLAGTMVKEARGVLIQSRIINIRNKQLLTTASKFIPSLVTSSIGE